MGTLKLQMHTSIDGKVGTQKGPTHFNWVPEIKQYSVDNLKNVDFILLGSKTAKNLIPHWKAVSEDPRHEDFAVGKAITDVPKIVFSKSPQKSEWANTKIENGDLVTAVNLLKKQGKNMLVYGGHGFAASLIQHGLIDEYHLLMNPVLLGDGPTISQGSPEVTRLTFTGNKVFDCGTILLRYKS